MKFVTAITLAAIATASAANASTLVNFDDDKDGSISVSEYLDAFGPEQGREQFYVIDKNNDLMIDVAEYQGATNGAGLLSNK